MPGLVDEGTAWTTHSGSLDTGRCILGSNFPSWPSFDDLCSFMFPSTWFGRVHAQEWNENKETIWHSLFLDPTFGSDMGPEPFWASYRKILVQKKHKYGYRPWKPRPLGPVWRSTDVLSEGRTQRGGNELALLTSPVMASAGSCNHPGFFNDETINKWWDSINYNFC